MLIAARDYKKGDSNMSTGNVKSLPNYEVVPLRSEEITIGVVQSDDRAVNGKNPAKGLKRNLDHMLDLIDRVQSWGGSKDLLIFHEFPLSGWSHEWDLQDLIRLSIELPGVETEEIGKLTKKHNCYVHFGAYAKEKDWPGRFVSMSIFIGPKGDIISKQWKARNIFGVFGGIALLGTTIYDVLDEYVEMYGKDALWPVARTDIGNMVGTPCAMEPEIPRAFAIKGTEIFIKKGTGSGGEHSRLDIRSTCSFCRFYGAFVNQAITPDNPPYLDDLGAGGSAIVDPQGNVLAEANSVHETLVTARIPIAAFRRNHSIPVLTKELYEPLFNEYQSKYPPNLFSKYTPKSLEDAGEYIRRSVVW